MEEIEFDSVGKINIRSISPVDVDIKDIAELVRTASALSYIATELNKDK